MHASNELFAKLGQVLEVPSKQDGDSFTLRIDELLGLGTFAGVFVATDLNTGKEYALKVTFKPDFANGKVADQDREPDSGYGSSLSLELMPSHCANEAVSESSSDSALDLMRREACIHGSIDAHPRITQFVTAFEDSDCAYLMTELYDDDLYNFIQRGAGPASARHEEESAQWVGNEILENDEAVRTLFLQLIEAVEHSHSHGIFHRDLKPENVLLDFKDVTSPLGFGIKVADFGLATRATFCKDLACGTRGYLPPESLDPTLDGYDPRLADVWALGVILINLRFQCKLWQTADPSDDSYYAQFLSSPAEYLNRTFPVFSDEFVDLLLKIFDPVPSQRASLQDIKNWVEAGFAFTREWEEMDFNSVFDAPMEPVQVHTPVVPVVAPVITTNLKSKAKNGKFDDSWWMDSDEEGPVFSPDNNSSPISTTASDCSSSIQSPPPSSSSSDLVSGLRTQPIAFVPSSIDSASATQTIGMSFSLTSSLGSLSQESGFTFADANDLPCPILDTKPYQVCSPGPKSPHPTGSGTQVTAFTATPDNPPRSTEPQSPINRAAPKTPKAGGVITTLKKMKDQLTFGRAQAAVENTLECLDAQMSGLRLELEDGITMGV